VDIGSAKEEDGPELPGVTYMSGQRCNAERVYARLIKPVLDRMLAAALLILLAPLMFLVSAAVRLSLGAPVIYRQRRLGRLCKPFTVFKFRSMTPDRRVASVPFKGAERRVSYEATDDPRHTWLGSLLRCSSLDELPQLWNVLRGEMSMVGPRPEVPPVVATYPEHAWERHLVRPGITGLWQVTARESKPMEAFVAIDIDYVRRVSFGLDCRILLGTLGAVLASARHPSRTAVEAQEAHETAARRWKRLLAQNVRWARRQGVRSLVEEHELHPIRRAAAAKRRARWRWTSGVAPGEAVAVFTVGMQRSGTNMVVRGLGALPEFEIHNEGDRRAFERYRLRPDPVIREIVKRSRHRFVLFKPLCETHRLTQLLDELATPQSPKALWAYRGVDGRVRSAVTKFGPAASDALRAIAGGSGGALWQALGLSVDSLRLIGSLDWNAATAEDGAALLWYVRNRLFFEQQVDRRHDVLLLSYTELTRSPKETMRGVCDFLGAEWRPAVSAHIDARAARSKPPVELHPEIRVRCDALESALDEAAAAPRAHAKPADRETPGSVWTPAIRRTAS
jgi:lipopolysaccharide/colanic/teichoic acid biosynthesis glycosyltransferase